MTVANADGTTTTFAQAFTAVAPTLSFVNGATKPSGNSGSTVILEGFAFGDAQGPGNVLERLHWFEAIVCTTPATRRTPPSSPPSRMHRSISAAPCSSWAGS